MNQALKVVPDLGFSLKNAAITHGIVFYGSSKPFLTLEYQQITLISVPT